MDGQEQHSGRPLQGGGWRWLRWGKSLPLGTQLLLLLLVVILIPMVLIAAIGESAGKRLQDSVRGSIAEMSEALLAVAPEMRDAAVARASEGLDERVRQEIERMTTDLARQVARFLYERDNDVLYAATLPPDPAAYRAFLMHRMGLIPHQGEWRLKDDGSGWEPVDVDIPLADANGAPTTGPAPGAAQRRLWKARPPEAVGIGVAKPLYLEMTFIDLDGQERVKVSADPEMSVDLRNVRRRENTFARAESYFDALRGLKPGEVHVTEMVGIYRPSRVVGTFTPATAEAAGLPFAPEESAYAGTENPVGKRFKGLVRWATPVVRNGQVTGYVTLALDQRHLAAFTDRLDPTEGRYASVPDPSQGNYAFMLDHKGRTITHPRHYYIVGHDPETGDLMPPWMEEGMYRQWQDSGLPIEEFLASAPTFDAQSLDKRPALEQLRQGTIAADCRFLNFAPQCAGWHALTAGGGSGSFQIFWSGVSKLNTAAPIPYYTGPYADSERGFGYITVGVNLERFHAPAQEISGLIDGIAGTFVTRTRDSIAALTGHIDRVIREAMVGVWVLGGALVLLSLGVATLFSRRLARRVTQVVDGIRTFKEGDRQHRIPVHSDDEIGRIADAFNVMAEEIDGAVHALMDSEQRFRATFQQSVLLLALLTPDGRLIKVNPAALRVIAAREGEVAGEYFWETPWWRDDPDQVARLKEAVANAAAGRIDRFTGTHKTPDGQVVVVDLTLVAVDLSTGVEILVVGHDVSDRHAMERQREALIERLGRSNAELSRFAEVTAHHLQEPVRRLGSFSTRLQRSLGEMVESLPDARVSLDFITENATHLRAMLQDVQTYLAADQARGDMVPVNAAVAVEEVRTRLADAIAEAEADIIVMPLPDVLIDMPRLRDVISVLLENALKFRRPDVPLKIVIEGRAAGDEAVLRVVDNGIGIDPRFRERVLEVFERLHRAADYRGTGIGLSIARRIAESMDGEVRIDDGIDGGTGVTVIFRRQGVPMGASAREMVE